MHQVTNEDIILALSVAIVALCLLFVAGFILGVWSTTKVPAQPVFPPKGMHKNFSMVEDEIKACKNKEDLRDAYLSIFAFEALYSDSASFASELYEMYDIRQQEIKGKPNDPNRLEKQVVPG